MKYFKNGLLLPLVCKVLYDNLILTALPEYYIYNVSYGINDVDAFKCLLSYIVFLIVSVITCWVLKKKRTYDILMLALFYLYYMPLNSSFYINNQSYVYFFFCNTYWVLLMVITYIWDRCNMNKMNRHFRFDMNVLFHNKLFYFLLFVIVAGCIIYGYSFNGLSLSIDIFDIYDKRADFVGTTNMLESFLFNFGGNIAIPIFLLFSINKRKYLFALIALFAQLAIYSVAAQKSQLLVVGIVFIIAMVTKVRVFKSVYDMIPCAFLILFSVGKLEMLLGKSSIIFSLLIRRLMYIPSWITTMYYDFFSSNPKLIWLQDVVLIDKLGLSRYDKSVLEIINANYFLGYVPSPNVGMFAEAYMHLGFIGVLLYPLLFVALIKWLFWYIEKYDEASQYYFAYAVCMALVSIPITSGVFVLTYIMIVPFTWFCIKFGKSRRRDNHS